jgi:F0F1-type ATP synthase epsilon subunit
MTPFHLTISAPGRLYFDDEVVYCKIVTSGGSLGIEAYHEPLLAVLKEGSTVTYKDESGGEKSLTIENGLLSFLNNNCIIVVSPSAPALIH